MSPTPRQGEKRDERPFASEVQLPSAEEEGGQREKESKEQEKT